MLKKLLDQAGYDALDAALQALYKKGEDGKWKLQLENDDSKALLDAKKAETEAKNAALAELARIKKEKEDAESAKAEIERTAAEEAAKKAGDIAALEKSWQEKLDAAVAKEKERGDSAVAALDETVASSLARTLAKEGFTLPEVMEPLLRARIETEITEQGVAIPRILNADGTKSALTSAELLKEFVDNEKYAPIAIGTQGSGGGASNQGNGGGAPGTKALKDMTATEEAKFANENPDEYARLTAPT